MRRFNLYKTFRTFGGLKKPPMFEFEFGGKNMLFETNLLESVLIDFTDSESVLERLFGPDGDVIPLNWSDATSSNLTALIEELRGGSADEKEQFLMQQCMIAKAIIAFATKCEGELYLVHQFGPVLELQFSFQCSNNGLRFSNTVRDAVEEATGLQI